MVKGGYQIVDFKDKDIFSVAANFKDEYDNLNSAFNSRKAVLLSGININGSKLPDQFSYAYKLDEREAESEDRPLGTILTRYNYGKNNTVGIAITPNGELFTF